MKKCVSVFLIIAALVSNAQQDSMQPPYKRFPTLPPFHILLSDSSSVYAKAQLPKKTPVLFMVFIPDCSHCQNEAEELVKRKNELKDLQVVMVTLQSLKDMNNFIDRYGLREIDDLVVGKDMYYLFPSFYDFRNLPFHALYNKKGDLVTIFEGSVGLDKVLETFRQQR